MRLLVVAATEAEIVPFLDAMRDASQHHLDVIITGVGMVATAAWCARALACRHYDAAFNLGLCGAFDPSLAPGTVVHVVVDRMPELGAEDGPAFISMHDLKLLPADEFPYDGGRLVNGAPPKSRALRALPAVTGITVNTVHGHEPSIEAVSARYAPQVESMEGAGFMYACAISEVPFAQVRAVSNVVERRNRAAWKIEDAVRSLGAAAVRIVESL